jgi:tetratricopeptide (TPR) repeat protein
MYAYNPRKKSYQQLEKSMVGDDRWDILNSILRELDLKKNEGPKQHWMIIGPRGIGKSHLMTLLFHKVKDNNKLAKKWTPILFPEELKLAASLHKILERALEEIVTEEQRGKQNAIAAELTKKIQNIKGIPTSEKANHFFDLLSWYYDKTGKHTLLIAENLQQLLGEKIPVIEQKKLRAFLQTSNALLIIGTATTIFNALHDHGHPFYHFFHIRRLKDLSFEDMKILILDLLSQRQQPGVKRDSLDGIARLKALYSFTGGNPRMAVFLADILSAEVPMEMLSLMDGVLDELTPYFESILQGIPGYQEELINTLAAFEPAQSPSEIAEHLEMPQVSVRNYLKQLKDDGYVRIAFSQGKSNYYCLNEYLYRIWYQMRDSGHREEYKWLIELLLMAYSRETLLNEKDRMALCSDDEQTAIHYKRILDQTVQFMNYYPANCKVIELCVDSILLDESNKNERNAGLKKSFEKAISLIDSQKYDQAIRICEDIIKKSPKSQDGYVIWGNCLRCQERYDEAIEKFKKAIELNHKFYEAYGAWGECLRRQERYDEAIEKFKKVIEINPKSYEAYGAWGECLRRQERYDEAIEKFKKAIELNPQYLDAYGSWGESLRKQEHYDEAIEKFKKVIELNPNEYRAYDAWGDCLRKQKRYDDAIENFKKAIELNPKYYRAYGAWGDCLRKQKRYDDAIEKFKKVIDLNPNDYGAYGTWGDCLRRQKRYEEAIEKFKKVIELNPKSDLAYLSWGECLHLQKRYDEAIEKYKQATEINSKFDQAYGAWAESLRKLGRNEEAIALFEANIKNINDCYALHTYASSLMETKRYNEAFVQFNKLLGIHPDCPIVYTSYGQLLEKRKDAISAVSAYLMQIKLRSGDFTRDDECQKFYGKYLVPLLAKLKPSDYIKQFFEPGQERIRTLKLIILLVLLAQYDIIRDYVRETFEEYPVEEGEEKRLVDLLIFTIKLNIGLKLVEKNFTDALKSTEMYIDYVKTLKTIKEKENEILNFSLNLFRNQIKFNVETGNIQEILKRLENEKEIPFSDVIFKIWTCLNEPESVEAQRYLTEKPISAVINQLKVNMKPLKKSKKHDAFPCQSNHKDQGHT